MGDVARRHFLTAGASLAAALLCARPGRLAAQGAPVSAGPADPTLIEDLVAVNRILVEQGVLDGYGHVSVRHDRAANRYLMSRSIAPALVTVADVLEYDLDNVAVDPRGRGSYLERFIHGEIYKARPDIQAVVHSHSPSVIPFGTTAIPLRPLYHMSAFLAGGAPVFDIRAASGAMTDMLVKTPALGAALARTLGSAPVVLMRGHGVVVVGVALPQVVFRSVYTEVNAKLQAQPWPSAARSRFSTRKRRVWPRPRSRARSAGPGSSGGRRRCLAERGRRDGAAPAITDRAPPRGRSPRPGVTGAAA